METESLFPHLEERRGQAAHKCKQVAAAVQAHQAKVLHAESALQRQQGVVAQLKRDYSAAAWLALSFTDEVHRAQVYPSVLDPIIPIIVAAQPPPHKPATPPPPVPPSSSSTSDRTGGVEPLVMSQILKLQAGFRQAAVQQERMAAVCYEEMSMAVDRLVREQAALPALEAALHKERSALEAAREESAKAREAYRLLMHAKQWTRYKW